MKGRKETVLTDMSYFPLHVFLTVLSAEQWTSSKLFFVWRCKYPTEGWTSLMVLCSVEPHGMPSALASHATQQQASTSMSTANLRHYAKQLYCFFINMQTHNFWFTFRVNKHSNVHNHFCNYNVLSEIIHSKYNTVVPASEHYSARWWSTNIRFNCFNCISYQSNSVIYVNQV
jgi:hypothetical protein